MTSVIKLGGKTAGAVMVSIGIGWLLVHLEEPISAGVWMFAALSGCLAFVLRGFYRTSEPINQAIVALGLSLSALPLFVAVGAVSAAITNNLRLAHFAAQVSRFPLPPDTRRVALSTRVGVFTGNGNHCDFSAALHVDSDLRFDAVREHYDRLQPRPAIPGAGAPHLEVVSTGQPEASIGVVLTDAGYPAGFDLRCH